ncbi:MAG TPA: class I SAM-dependent methyltransferase [Chitinophagaceae bacterium]|nr:class I SAM-dependent methyltransferase [Chitinophagaceae bacterium]
MNEYRNTEEYNDKIFEDFCEATNSIGFLKKHRDFIEQNALGFGERAFHYMWFLLIESLSSKNNPVSVLEIGVYKGQILSLWALIAKSLNLPLIVNGITPLKGKKRPGSKLWLRLNHKASKKYKEDIDNGNFYEEADYYSIIRSVFEKFDLDFSSVNLMKGYSTQRKIIKQASKKKYSIIYIDGDHSYQGALFDIQNYSPLLEEGGFLVMDDASCYLPSTKFWKGHKAVSDACNILPELGFKNILNVGHNRVFQK